MPEKLLIQVSDNERVTALLYSATKPRLGTTLVLGHGAGADQTSDFMVGFAQALAARGIDTVTFNFIYTERRRRSPDSGDKLEACYRAVVDAVRAHTALGKNRLVIGGKSMGGRIASQVAAQGVADLAGLLFLGYPLHPPGKPDQLRSKHLSRIRAPMLFIQGSRDAFGAPDELRPVIGSLDSPGRLYVVEGGDHSFKVPRTARVSQEKVYASAQDEIVRWLGR